MQEHLLHGPSANQSTLVPLATKFCVQNPREPSLQPAKDHQRTDAEEETQAQARGVWRFRIVLVADCSQVESVAGAAHLPNDYAGVPR